MEQTPGSQGGAIRRWWDPASGRFEPPQDAGSSGPSPYLVDSFLLDGGSVVGWESHEQRFLLSCAALLPEVPTTELTRFLRATRDLPFGSGRWYPQLEAYRPGGSPRTFAVLVRPAPEQPTETSLWTADVRDPRGHPRHKGPDAALLERLRSMAASHGADQAVLTDPNGFVLETDHSALAWWRGRTLCIPDPAMPRLRSITQDLLVAAAQANNTPVQPERMRPEDLRGREVWSLNARTGIVHVTSWSGAQGPISVVQRSTRIHFFRDYIRTTW